MEKNWTVPQVIEVIELEEEGKLRSKIYKIIQLKESSEETLLIEAKKISETESDLYPSGC